MPSLFRKLYRFAENTILTILFSAISLYAYYQDADFDLLGGGIVPAAPQSRTRRLQEQPHPLHPPWSWYRPWTWLTKSHPVSIAYSYPPATNERASLLTLPAEIRNQIYDEALGGRILHIETAALAHQGSGSLFGFKGSMPRKTVIHTQCSRARGERCRCFSWRIIHPFRGDDDQTPLDAEAFVEALVSATIARSKMLENRPSRIAPLLVCRQIYAETLPVLYGGNELHLHDPWDFISFSRSIRLETLSMVTQLDVQWACNDCVAPSRSHRGQVDREASFELWRLFWEVVAAKMPGLRDLKASWEVIIYRPEFSSMEWVKPMMKVHGLRSCEIEMRHIQNDQAWGKVERGCDDGLKPVMPFERDLEQHMCGNGDDLEV